MHYKLRSLWCRAQNCKYLCLRKGKAVLGDLRKILLFQNLKRFFSFNFCFCRSLTDIYCALGKEHISTSLAFAGHFFLLSILFSNFISINKSCNSLIDKTCRQLVSIFLLLISIPTYHYNTDARSQKGEAQALGMSQMWWYLYQSAIFWRTWSWFQKMELQLCWALLIFHIPDYV